MSYSASSFYYNSNYTDVPLKELFTVLNIQKLPPTDITGSFLKL